MVEMQSRTDGLGPEWEIWKVLGREGSAGLGLEWEIRKVLGREDSAGLGPE